MSKHFTRLRNGFAITFDNGWCIDAVFAKGDYADNRHVDLPHIPIEDIESDTCESMIYDPDMNDKTFEIAKKLNIRVDGNAKSLSVLPYLSFSDWLKLVNYINAIPKKES